MRKTEAKVDEMERQKRRGDEKRREDDQILKERRLDETKRGGTRLKGDIRIWEMR